MVKIEDIDIRWLGHSGFLIQNSKIIYIDPYNIKDGLPKADIVLITHSHYDHCSFADLKKIVQEGTKIIMTADCQSSVTKFDTPIKMEIIEPGKELDLGEVKLVAIPAYNIGKHFHPKDEGWVGYIIKMNNVIVYHSGDCDLIPEMKNLTGFKHQGKKFVALLPIGGRFTMSAEEAAEAAKIIKPSIVIPMHWGSIVGSEDDVKEFSGLCHEAGINVLVLEKE